MPRVDRSPAIVSTIRDTIRPVFKTTLYLPDELRDAIKAAAARQGASEAEVIRAAIKLGLASQSPRPRGALFTGSEEIADRVDELLGGFGAA